MSNLLPSGKPLEEWMVVVECGGQSILTVMPDIVLNPDGFTAG
jgi:hypothetical protein